MDDDELLDAIAELYERVQVEKEGADSICLGTIPENVRMRLGAVTGKDFTDYTISFSFDALRHIFLMHGKSFDRFKDQRPVTPHDMTMIPRVIFEFDEVEFQLKDSKVKRYHDSLLFNKLISTEHYVACEIRYKTKELLLRTFYIKNR